MTRSLGGGLEELGVGLNGGADDEGVGVVEFGGEAVFDLIGGDDLPAGFLLKDGESGWRDFFGENDLQGLPQLGGFPLPARKLLKSYKYKA